jgi:hypothetical protein
VSVNQVAEGIIELRSEELGALMLNEAGNPS